MKNLKEKLRNQYHSPLQQKEYLGINLPNEIRTVHKNYTTLVKEIKDDINRWRDIPCSWVGRVNIVKMTILLNTIYRFSVVPIKLPMAFFTETEQNFHNSYGNTKDPEANAVLRKKNGVEGINLPDFRLYCKAIVIKTV